MARTRIHNLSISLDGFATGEPQSADAPFGHAGQRLHEPFHTLPLPRRAYDIEAVPSPSGVVHLTLTRRAAAVGRT